jgi:hypothetical protein
MQWQMVGNTKNVRLRLARDILTLSTVDCLWHHGRLRRRSCILSCTGQARSHRPELEVDDGIRLLACNHRGLLRIPMS